MSFSYDIKEKLSKINHECEFCEVAELCGIMKFAASVRDGKITILIEHEAVAKRISQLFSSCVGFLPECIEYAGGFRLEIVDESKTEVVVQRLRLTGNFTEAMEDITPFQCCRCSYIRGAFLGGGSISDPKKNYHMEFDAKTQTTANELIEVLKKEGVNARITLRKGHYIVYIKGYEEIADLLGMIGAGSASMEIYNVSIEKEIRNEVNRRMNCESANIDKVVKAYGRHLLAIEKINRTIGFTGLPESLREIARIRMEYPDESLKELGSRLENPIGKSGVNHRLNRLIEIADKL